MTLTVIDGYKIELSNQNKVFYKKLGVTKGDIIEYYQKIFPVIESHVADRPLTLHRYPDGIKGEDFYQKEAPEYIPDFIDTVEIEKKNGEKQYQIICNKKATIAYLANLGTISLHIWLSKSDMLFYPDKLVFDLDPPKNNFDSVREAAFDFRDYLNELNIDPYVMTTGSEGLHVVIPILRKRKFNQVRDIASNITSALESKFPEKYTTAIRKHKREGRVFLDIARNAYGQTSVSPYSLRARDECSVATPIDWDELNSDIDSKSYTIKNIFRRLGQKKDPWKKFYSHPQKIEKLEKIMEK